MEAKAYQYIQTSENSWWYRGRKEVISRMLFGVLIPDNGRVLDFGAGYGAMHAFLKQYGSVYAYEIEPTAAEWCCTRGYARVITNYSDFPKSPIYSLIGAFDVIEHIEDDRAALAQIYQLLEPGGIFIATVPAFMFLWSKHDDLHHHFRRYTLQEIQSLFVEAGFISVRASYWNMVLFPIAYVLRFFGKGGGEVLTLPAFINWSLTKLLHLEAMAITFFALPFGTGIVIVGKKPCQHSSV